MNPYKQFTTERAKYEARIEDLKEELTLTESELQELRQEREAVLRDVLGFGDIGDDIEIRIEAVRKRIERLRERIKYAEDAKIEQLTSILPDIEQQRQRDEKKKIAEYEET